MRESEDQKQLRKIIFEIIENQIRDNDPPETKQTLHRLRAEGYSHEEAMKLIGCVVTSEIFEVLKQLRPFDPVGYVNALNRLPTLPDE